MNILIAPDSFKGSITAKQFIDVFTNKFEELNVPAKIVACPLADGGEGSLEVISDYVSFEKRTTKVLNPFFQEIETWYLLNKSTNTAYIEMAKASGLVLVQNPNVMNASSFGTGQLIKDAIENGVKEVILFIGGSATNDAAMGIANALGIQFYDRSNKNLKPVGKNLTYIYTIDDSKSILKAYHGKIIIAADVNNPFYGKKGASHIYAAQKGATQSEVVHLDKGLKNLATIIKTQYNIDVQKIRGSGAAGGIGGGMIALFNAELVSGSELIFDLLNIKQKIKAADLVITGEGKIDNQTLNDKLIFKLSKLANKLNKKVWAICGYFDGDNSLKNLLGIENIFSLANSKKDVSFAIDNAKTRLSEKVIEVSEDIMNVKTSK